MLHEVSCLYGMQRFAFFALVLLRGCAITPVYAGDPAIAQVRVVAYNGRCTKDCWRWVKPRWTLASLPGSATCYAYDAREQADVTAHDITTIVLVVHCRLDMKAWRLAVWWLAPGEANPTPFWMVVPNQAVVRERYCRETGQSLPDGETYEHHSCRTVVEGRRGIWRATVMTEGGRTLWAGQIEVR